MAVTKYKVKRLWKGFASVRDYVVKRAYEAGNDLELTLFSVVGKKVMTIRNDELKRRLQIHGTAYQSKFGGKSYELYDFAWKEDGDKKIQQQEESQQQKLF